MTTTNLSQNEVLDFQSTKMISVSADLLDKHSQFCIGLKCLIESGATPEELRMLFERLCDQVDELGN